MADRYRLSFTTGGLFVQEAASLAASYLTTGDWAKARTQARQENLLQVRTAAAATRISKEVTARLEHLDDQELKALLQLNLHDRASLLWVAACRRYTFIREFATEVLRENHLHLRRQLSFNDYESFFSSKALWHAELDRLRVSAEVVREGVRGGRRCGWRISAGRGNAWTAIAGSRARCRQLARCRVSPMDP